MISWAHFKLNRGLAAALAALIFVSPVSALALALDEDADSDSHLPRRFSVQPLGFEPNLGQTDAGVRFLARGNGYRLFLTDDQRMVAARSGSAVTIRLAGANKGSVPLPESAQSGRVNYLIGKNRTIWKTDLPLYDRVRYSQIYPGIDLLYYGDNAGTLEHDFIVAPGADPSRIRIKAEDVRRLQLDANGDLILKTSTGEARLLKPVVYQEIGGKRVELNAAFRIRGPDTIGFRLPRYDRTRALIIDPILVFSTYFGGGDGATIRDMKADANGNVYIVGDTVSINLPVLGAYQGAVHGLADAFVTKLNAGGQLVYSTYLGGSSTDEGDGIAVDSSGNAYIIGTTSSSADFPIANCSVTLYCTAPGGGDYFVVKLNAAGNDEVYSTFLGSTTTEFGQLTRFQRPSIAVHTDGTAYIAGNTFGNNFPVVNGQAKNSGIANPGGSVAARIAADGNSLIYSTYLPNQQIFEIASIAVDSNGNSYLAGTVPGNADVLPTATGGAFRQSLQGYDDGFVVKMSSSGAVSYATYLGGGGADGAFGIAVDNSGNAYVTGYTGSVNWPVKNAYQGTCHGIPFFTISLCWDAFVTKLNAAGSDIVYSTYFGGTGNDSNGTNPGGVDYGYGIAVDANGKAYVSGVTQSPDFPLAGAYQSTCPPDPKGGCGNDGWAAIFTATGGLEFSTYFGGTGYDSADAIALDGNGNFYLAGNTQSTNFPRLNALQSSFPASAGTNVGFVAKFSTAAAAPGLNPSVPSLTFAGQIVNTTSTSQQVTLTSNGNTSVNISGISVSGDYAQTNNCPSVLALGATCTVNVTFTPSAQGARNGTLTISDNAGGHSVSLSGTGLATPSISFSPSSLTFTSLAAGQISAAQAVTITNSGATPVTFTSVVASSQFSVPSQTCTAAPLNQNGTCTVNVDFRPTTGGPASGTVTISSNAAGNPHFVTLSGTGLAPSISVLPASLNFPDTLAGQTSDPQRILVTNAGNLNLVVSAVNLNNNSAAAYSLTTTCVATIVPGGTCFIDVLFKPATIGNFNTSTITFSSNTSGPTIALAGKGTGATLTFNPTSLTFASAQNPQPIGVESAPQSFTATASGGFPIHINQIQVGSDYLLAHDCPQLLAAGAFCTVNVTFRPGSGGTRNSNLTFVTDAAVANPNLTVPLSGTAATAGVNAVPKTITFPTTAVNQNPGPIGTTNVINFTAGSVALTGFPNNFTLGGPDASSFGHIYTGCENNNSLPQNGGSCVLQVTFVPTSTGTKDATLTMAYTGTTGSPLVINLVGPVGSAPNVSLAPTATPTTPYLFFTNPITNVGTTSTSQAVTLKNTGGAVLNVSGIVTSQDFSQTNNCTATLAVGASCTINVSFSPIATGTRYGTLTVTDDASGSPHTLLMVGTAGNRTPVVTDVSPSDAAQGRSILALTVHGQFFMPGTLVKFNGSNRSTIVQDSGTLLASIPASEFVNAGTVQVTAVNPTPGGGAGNNIAFTITPNASPVGALESAKNQADNTTTVPQFGTLAASGWAADPDDGSPVSRVQVRVVPPGTTNISGLYFLDSTHNVVRYIDSFGNISTVAGNGIQGFSGDGGVANGASLSFSAIGIAGGLAVDNSGNLYISDTNNCRVRKVDAVTHVITTVAGGGCAATGLDGASATLAGLPAPLGLAVAANGDIYIPSQQRIRKVSGGIISTVAGSLSPQCGFGNDNVSNGASSTSISTLILCNPTDVAVAANGDFYIADGGSNVGFRIRKVSNNVITTVVGDGTTNFADNVAPTATGLNNPLKVNLDANGNLIITDLSHGRVRKVDFGANKITTVAGNGGGSFAGDGGSATSASFGGFFYSTIDQDGNIFVADRNVHRIRRVDAQSGNIATIAGNGTAGYTGDGGLASAALLDKPLAMVALGKTVSPNTVSIDATLGGIRSDIASAQSRPDYTSSGWTADLNIGLVAPGSYEAQAVAYDSVGASKLLTGAQAITVSVGQYALLSLSGSSLNFGSQLVGGFTSAQSITVTNNGTVPMSLNVGVSSGFTVTNSCGNSVPANASCLVSVQFHPGSVGVANGTLSFQTDSALNANQNVSLTGTGTDITITMTRPSRPARSSADTVVTAKTTPTDLQVSAADPGHTSITVTCSGAPSGTRCELSPSQFLLEDAAQTIHVRLVRAATGFSRDRSLRLRAAASGQPVNLQVTVSTGALTRTVTIAVPVP